MGTTAAAAPVGFGTVAGFPAVTSNYQATPYAFGTTAFQANLPALTQPVAVPQYQAVVADQAGYTQALQTGLPTAQSMIAYPGVSAMEGPFKFTAGGTYQSGAGTAAAGTGAVPKAAAKEDKPAEKPAAKADKPKT